MRIVVTCLLSLSLPQLAIAQAADGARDDLGLAEYTRAGELVFPDNVDEWIHLGSAIGHGYSEDLTFDPDDPGTIHIVQIEPAAYRYFLENKRYADGTMLLLSFYRTMAAPNPDLNGFTQGDLAAREIHVIDRAKFADERGFFLFDPAARSSPMVPAGNECVTCHAEHGRFDSTFTQFYPLLRELLEPPRR
jgi:hypothetical protein